MTKSPYFNLGTEKSIPAKLAALQRRRMYARFVKWIGIDDRPTVLDVGVTDNQTYQSDNYFEALFPFKDKITAAGIEDARHLETKYPGLRFVQIKPGRLPFSDKEFDVAHSSAVLEHVGNRGAQAEFIHEMMRVSREAIFLTTPNRWFPVEFHTRLPFAHWLPPNAFRAIVRVRGDEFFSKEQNLNLLTARSLHAAALKAGIKRPIIKSVRLGGWPSNLLLIAFRDWAAARRSKQLWNERKGMQSG